MTGILTQERRGGRRGRTETQKQERRPIQDPEKMQGSTEVMLPKAKEH